MIKKFDNNFNIEIKDKNNILFSSSTIPDDVEYSITSILQYLKTNKIKSCKVLCGEVSLQLTCKAEVKEVTDFLTSIKKDLKSI